MSRYALAFRSCCLLSGGIGLLAAAQVHAELPFPAANATTWTYALTREPEGAHSKFTRTIVASDRDSIRINATSEGAKPETEIWTRSGDAVTARFEGGSSNSQSATTLLPPKFEEGASWNFEGEIAGTRVSLPQTVADNEEVEVPAGKFHAWRIHGESNSGRRVISDRWFVPGVGFVKETVTERSPTGELLDRADLELTAMPANSTPAPPFEASISTSTGGKSVSVIPDDALQIVARWRVLDAPAASHLRAIWIAEDTGGVAPENFRVDDADAALTERDTVGTFKLERPRDGWAAGRYRIEFYLNERLVHTLHLTIASGSE